LCTKRDLLAQETIIAELHERGFELLSILSPISWPRILAASFS
jgi:hypothetical protein